jgi:hypothetical protein
MYYSATQDTLFHLSRIESIASSWRHGTLIPDIAYRQFGNFGYGIHLFYPYLTLLPFAAIRFFCSNPVQAYIIGQAFLTFSTLVIGYYFMKKFCLSRTQSIIFTVIYSFSNYRAIDIFTRHALGEALALMVLPIVFWGIYNLFCGDQTEWYWASIGGTLLLSSHVLSVLLVIPIVLYLVISSVIKKQLINRTMAITKALLVAILLSAFFWLPFLQHLVLVNIHGVFPYKPAGVGLFYLLFGRLFNPVQHVESDPILIITILLFFYRKFILKTESKLYTSVFSIGALFLFVSSSIFPWTLFENSPLSIIQFSFRLLGIVAFYFSVYLSHAISDIKMDFSSKIVLGVAAAALISIHLISTTHVKNGYISNGTVLTPKNYHNTLNRCYNLDYVPEPAILEGTHAINPRFINSEIIVNHEASDLALTQDGNGWHIETTPTNSLVNIPLTNYPGYIAHDQNGKQLVLNQSQDGALEIQTGSDTKCIRISYTKTILHRFGIVLSLMMLCLLVLAALKRFFRVIFV